MAPVAPEARRQILAGLRELRDGKISAALDAWEAALTADPEATDAAAYRDYVKQNRIRIAVLLGRSPPAEDAPIVLPKNWPPAPPGLCDPVPSATAAPAPAPAPVSPSPEDEPYAAREIGGAGARAAAAEAPEAIDDSSEYAVLEIVVEDEEDPIEVSGALPPPPEAMDAPEIVLEAPKEEQPPAEAQGDYVMDRANQEGLDSLGLERLAGPLEPGAPPAVPPPPPPPAAQTSPGAGGYAEDAPTIARDPEASPPRAFPGQEPAAPPEAGGPHETLDRFPTSPGPRAPAPPPGASPHATLMGTGFANPFVAGAVPQFGQPSPAAPPSTPLPSPPPDASAPLRATGEDGPTLTRGPRHQKPPAGDFTSSEGSFSEDIPTRMRSRHDSGPMGRAMIRPMPLDDAEDFSSGEGSFSDDLPTQARAVPPTPAPTAPQRPSEPGDFAVRESSFSDDMPTRARDGIGAGHPQLRPMPLSGEHSGERSFEEQVTLERRGERARPRTNDEIEALLDPERGLALARRLHADGAYDRSLQVVERLQARYGELPGCDELLEKNQRALEKSLLEDLGSLDAYAVPRAPAENLSSLDLDPRAAFLFTRIDGTMTLEDLLDISGMSRFETTRILLKLRDLGLLVFEPGR